MEASYSSISTMSYTGGCIKLAINNDEQFRRIAVSRLLRDKTDMESISFALLEKYAIKYSSLKDESCAAISFIVNFTYLDEEGDLIQISTDEELADAIMLHNELKNMNHRASVLTINASVQVDHSISKTVKQTVERATATIQTEEKAVSTLVPDKEDSSSQTEASAAKAEEKETLVYSESLTTEKENITPAESEPEKEETSGSFDSSDDKKESSISTQNDTKSRTYRRPHRQRRNFRNRRRSKHQKHAPPVKAALNTVIDFVSDTVDTITAGLSPYPASTNYTQTVFDPNFIHARHTCDGCGVSPIVGYRYHATNIPDFDLCLPCKKKCVLSDINFIQAQDGVTMGTAPSTPEYEGIDPNFVHSRHTCDGCGVSPIVGYRWHSTNIANYDLCNGCKSKTVSSDITFKLQQIELDRAYPKSDPIQTIVKPTVDEEDSSSPGLQKALQMSYLESNCVDKKPDCDDNKANNKPSSSTDNEPLALSASEAFEFLVSTGNKIEDEDKKKPHAQLIENDSFSDTGTQTEIGLLSSAEDNSPSTDKQEGEIIERDEKDDIDDSFTSVEKEDSGIVSEKSAEEKVTDKTEPNEIKTSIDEDDEWAMIEDETVHEAIGSCLFRQGLSSS